MNNFEEIINNIYNDDNLLKENNFNQKYGKIPISKLFSLTNKNSSTLDTSKNIYTSVIKTKK